MKTKWIENEFLYDGSQLRGQFAYLQYGVLGPSIVSWKGACDISQANMADGEDLLQGAKICGSLMLHFIIELFDIKLFAGVSVQRLFTTIVRDVITELRPQLCGRLRRDGDDIYFETKKLSISVAAQSPLSCVIHFAVNISNQGTPVPTCALEDFEIDPKEFALVVMAKFQKEMASVQEATYKVLPIY